MTADAPDDAARRARVATDRAMIRQLAHYCGPAMLKLAVLTQNFCVMDVVARLQWHRQCS